MDERSTHIGGKEPLPLIISSGLRRQHRAKIATNIKKRMTTAGYGRFIVQKPRPGVTPKRAGRSRQGIGDIRRGHGLARQALVAFAGVSSVRS